MDVRIRWTFFVSINQISIQNLFTSSYFLKFDAYDIRKWKNTMVKKNINHISVEWSSSYTFLYFFLYFLGFCTYTFLVPLPVYVYWSISFKFDIAWRYQSEINIQYSGLRSLETQKQLSFSVTAINRYEHLWVAFAAFIYGLLLQKKLKYKYLP